MRVVALLTFCLLAAVLLTTGELQSMAASTLLRGRHSDCEPIIVSLAVNCQQSDIARLCGSQTVCADCITIDPRCVWCSDQVSHG